MPPPIDVREDWTKRRYGRDQSGYWAELGWTVAWAPSALAAEEAVGVKINDPFLFSTKLVCTWIGCERYTLNYAEVRGTFHQVSCNLNDLSDPLNQPPRIKWRLCQRTIAVDRDVWGNPITNSAGDPFRNPAHLESPILGFTIARQEPFYNPQTTIAYLGKYNSAAWAPMGVPAIMPGQARCTSVLPVDEYTTAGLSYLKIAYEFEADGGLVQDPDQVWDAWRYRVLDVGTMGWYTDSGTTKRGVFCDGAGNPLSCDVRLDGTGKPLDSTIKVTNPGGGTPYSPVANPAWASNPPSHVYVDSGGGSTGKWITFSTRKSADFNDFGF